MSAAPLYMLDTNMCLYIQRNSPERVAKKLDALQSGQAVISFFTWGEIVYGIEKLGSWVRMKSKMKEFLSLIPVMSITTKVADIYGRVRAELEESGHTIGNNDCWIAAHALASELILVTSRTEDFEMVRNLKIENWLS